MKPTAMLFAGALTLAVAAPLAAGEPGKECGGPHGSHGFGPEKFATMDADGDGKLSFEEFRAAKEKRLQSWYERIDADGDGAVTQEELAAVKARHHRGEKETETETE
ncbi:MAG: EF-hand domain-containing protein [Candidatus Binatia bacterium]